MTTIPRRLRDIAERMRPNRYDTYEAENLLRIAAELEAPAADAVPVVSIAGLPDVTLIRQRDHLATVAALQARIDELEARWNLCSACNAELGGSK